MRLMLVALLCCAAGAVAAPGVQMVPTDISAREGQNTSYRVRLATQPSSSVEIRITPLLENPPKPGLCATTWTGYQSRVHMPLLEFNTSNWQTWQTVQLAALDDDCVELLCHMAVVGHKSASNDSDYHNIAIYPQFLRVVDNDSPLLSPFDHASPNVASNRSIFYWGNSNKQALKTAAKANDTIEAGVRTLVFVEAIDYCDLPKTLVPGEQFGIDVDLDLGSAVSTSSVSRGSGPFCYANLTTRGLVRSANVFVRFYEGSLSQHIYASPLVLRVVPGPINSKKSFAIGRGVTALQADQVGTFTIYARDEFGNARDGAKDDSGAFQVTLFDQTNANRTTDLLISLSVSHDQSALATSVAYRVRKTGPYRLRVNIWPRRGHLDKTTARARFKNALPSYFLGGARCVQVPHAHVHDHQRFPKQLMIASVVICVGRLSSHLMPDSLLTGLELTGSPPGFTDRGSPFSLTVSAGPLSLSKCWASGQGTREARAGVQAQFMINMADSSSNIRRPYSFPFVSLSCWLQLAAPGRAVNGSSRSLPQLTIQGSVSTGQAGYICAYETTISGTYTLRVADGAAKLIGGMPMRNLVVHAGDAVPGQYSVHHLDVGKMGVPSAIQMNVGDVFGNAASSTCDTLTGVCASVPVPDVWATREGMLSGTKLAVQKATGTYRVGSWTETFLSFTALLVPEQAGRMRVDMLSDGLVVGGQPLYISSVSGFLSVNKTSVFGSGTSGVAAGFNGSFTVVLRDARGYALAGPVALANVSANVNATLLDPSNAARTIPLHQQVTGGGNQFLFTFETNNNLRGNWELLVKVRQQAVWNSTVSIVTSSGVRSDVHQTMITGPVSVRANDSVVVQLQAHSTHGLAVPRGGDDFKVTILHLPSNESLFVSRGSPTAVRGANHSASLGDTGTGLYNLVLRCSVSGTLFVSIELGNVAANLVNYTVVVLPSVTSIEHSYVVAAASKVAAGDGIVSRMYSRDEFSNLQLAFPSEGSIRPNVNVSAVGLELDTASSRRPILRHEFSGDFQIENGTNIYGAFQVWYNATQAGDYIMAVQLQKRTLSGSPVSIRVVAAQMEPSRSSISGSGLTGGTVEAPLSIVLLPLDRFDNPASVTTAEVAIVLRDSLTQDVQHSISMPTAPVAVKAWSFTHVDSAPLPHCTALKLTRGGSTLSAPYSQHGLAAINVWDLGTRAWRRVNGINSTSVTSLQFEGGYVDVGKVRLQVNNNSVTSLFAPTKLVFSCAAGAPKLSVSPLSAASGPRPHIISYHTTRAGSYEMRLLSKGGEVKGGAKAARTVFVSAGSFAESKSSITMWTAPRTRNGVVEYVQAAGNTSYFTMTAKDQYSNIRDNQELIKASFTHGVSKTYTLCNQTQVPSGRYDFTAIVTKSGSYILEFSRLGQVRLPSLLMSPPPLPINPRTPTFVTTD